MSSSSRSYITTNDPYSGAREETRTTRTERNGMVEEQTTRTIRRPSGLRQPEGYRTRPPTAPTAQRTAVPAHVPLSQMRQMIAARAGIATRAALSPPRHEAWVQSRIQATREGRTPPPLPRSPPRMQMRMEEIRTSTTSTTPARPPPTKVVKETITRKLVPPGGGIPKVSQDVTVRRQLPTGHLNISTASASKPATALTPGTPRQQDAMRRAQGPIVSNLQRKVASQIEKARTPIRGVPPVVQQNIKARGMATSEVAPPIVETKTGLEEAEQQIILEKRTEKTRQGEQVSKTITTIEATGPGTATKQELNVQKLSPNKKSKSDAIKEVITETSVISITPGHTTTTSNVVKETTGFATTLPLTTKQVSQLVKEEREDIENTLRISPPHLVNASPENLSMKKRLQKMRLNSESMAFLEQSVIYPPATADEALQETPPEILASMMQCTEKGFTPESAPVQLFNSLFADSIVDTGIIVSSVTPGPMVDIVIPKDVPQEIHAEALNKDMEEAALLTQSVEKRPADNNFGKSEPKRKVIKERKKKPYKPISEEQPPFSMDDLAPIIENVGAHPIDNVEPANVADLTQDKTLMTSLQEHGIEYYLDTDAVQYQSKIQLRGSCPPPWFPGYMMALPDLTDVVKIARSPSEVLLTAWRAVQPNYFPDESVVFN